MDYVIEERQLQPAVTAVEHFHVPVAQIPNVIGKAYGDVAAAVMSGGNEFAGPPFARYFLEEPPAEGEAFDFEAGFPVARPIMTAGDVKPGQLPGGRAIVTTHVGPYDTMGPAYDALHRWMEEHHRQPDGAPWEVYFSDPEQTDPSQFRTEIVQPLAG